MFWMFFGAMSDADSAGSHGRASKASRSAGGRVAQVRKQFEAASALTSPSARATEERPAVSDVHVFSSASLAEVLHLAVAAEVHSEHPLGQAMLQYAAKALGMGLSGGG